MGFKRFIKYNGRKVATGVRCCRTSTGSHGIALPHTMLEQMGADDTVDVMIGDGEDAGAIALVSGPQYKVRHTTRSALVRCARVLYEMGFSTDGPEPEHYPRYEWRDKMLVIWPGEPSRED